MTYDEIPPLLPPGDLPAVLRDADLRLTWRALVGEPGFSDRRLWLLFLDRDGRPGGPLLAIEDLPDGPWDLAIDDLVTICRDILDGPGGGGSVAMLLTRPGRDSWHLGDRAWSRYLVTAAHRIGGRVWPVHRAHDGELAAVEPEAPAGRTAPRRGTS